MSEGVQRGSTAKYQYIARLYHIWCHPPERDLRRDVLHACRTDRAPTGSMALLCGGSGPADNNGDTSLAKQIKRANATAGIVQVKTASNVMPSVMYNTSNISFIRVLMARLPAIYVGTCTYIRAHTYVYLLTLAWHSISNKAATLPYM